MLPNLELYMQAAQSPSMNKFLKRAKWHDYRSRCIYMVTLMKMPGIPEFSIIKGYLENGKAHATVQPIRLGHHIGRALRNLPKHFPELRVLQYVFMPDHIHLLLEITRPVQYHLGDAVRVFKQDCNMRYQAILKEEFNYDFEGHVFTDGYNDRIIRRRGQLNTLFEYIRDNPRRLFLRRNFPEYFLSNILLRSSEQEYSLFGNLLLLENPEKSQVRFSSKYTPEELNTRRQVWEEAIRNGGVLVSPFYHPMEKEYLNKAIEDGGKIIIICENGFPPRWKPEKRFMDLCAEGRMLFVGPRDFDSRKQTLTRAACLKRNEDAKYIAALHRGDYTLHRRP